MKRFLIGCRGLGLNQTWRSMSHLQNTSTSEQSNISARGEKSDGGNLDDKVNSEITKILEKYLLSSGRPVPLIAKQLPDELLDDLNEGLVSFLNRFPQLYQVRKTDLGYTAYLTNRKDRKDVPSGAAASPSIPGAPPTWSRGYTVMKALERRRNSVGDSAKITSKGDFLPYIHLPDIKFCSSQHCENLVRQIGSVLMLTRNLKEIVDVQPDFIANLSKAVELCEDFVQIYAVPKHWLKILEEQKCVKLFEGKHVLEGLKDNTITPDGYTMYAQINESYEYLAVDSVAQQNDTVVEDYDRLRVARYVKVEMMSSLAGVAENAKQATQRDLFHVLLSHPHMFKLGLAGGLPEPSEGPNNERGRNVNGVQFLIHQSYVPKERREGSNDTFESVTKQIADLADAIKSSPDIGEFKLPERLRAKRERRRLKVVAATFKHGLSSLMDFDVAAQTFFDTIGPNPLTTNELAAHPDIPPIFHELTYVSNIKFFRAYKHLFRVYEIPPNTVVQCLDCVPSTDALGKEGTRQHSVPEDIATDEIILGLVKATVCDSTPFAAAQGRNPYVTSVTSRLPKFVKDALKTRWNGLLPYAQAHPNDFTVKVNEERLDVSEIQVR